MIKRAFASSCAAVALMALALAPAARAADSVKIGQTAPAFTLQDQDGKDVSLTDYAGKVVVLEWTNPRCPYVQRHYREQTMIKLSNAYRDKGVVWLAINSTHDTANADNKQWVEKNGLKYPVLNDSTGKVGHAYNAKTTPDMFVIDKDGKLAYAGAIDDDAEGEKDASARINYVEKAMDQLLSGQAVVTSETKPYGCGVKYSQ
jgi:peroxiredoxin